MDYKMITGSLALLCCVTFSVDALCPTASECVLQTRLAINLYMAAIKPSGFNITDAQLDLYCSEYSSIKTCLYGKKTSCEPATEFRRVWWLAQDAGHACAYQKEDLRTHKVCLMKMVVNLGMGEQCTRRLAGDEPHLKEQRDNGTISLSDYKKHSCQILTDYLDCQEKELQGKCGNEAAKLWVDISRRSVQRYANEQSFGCRIWMGSERTTVTTQKITQKRTQRPIPKTTQWSTKKRNIVTTKSTVWTKMSTKTELDDTEKVQTTPRSKGSGLCASTVVALSIVFFSCLQAVI